MHTWIKIFLLQSSALLCAWVAAHAAHFLYLPLPWLLGPLLMAMLWQSFNIQQPYLLQWRQGGQWLIGTTLGAYFTPTMLNILYDYAVLLLIGILWAIFLGGLLAFLQYRLARLDWATAWFSSSMGGASEMVNFAEGINARSDQVAAAHSLRLVLLVFFIPLLIQQLYSIEFNNLQPLTSVSSHVLDLIFLLLVSLSGAYLAQQFKILNAWVLGPLMIVAILTLWDVQLASLPQWLLHLGQLLIGWSLGRKFPFRLLQQERKFFLCTFVLNLVGLALSVGMAYFVAALFELDLKTIILGFAPGGIAEMSLTAKALQLAVPVVVAFQLSRLIVVLLTSLYLYRITQRHFRLNSKKSGSKPINNKNE